MGAANDDEDNAVGDDEQDEEAQNVAAVEVILDRMNDKGEGPSTRPTSRAAAALNRSTPLAPQGTADSEDESDNELILHPKGKGKGKRSSGASRPKVSAPRRITASSCRCAAIYLEHHC